MAFTATTTNSAAAWRPDLFTFEPANVVPDALILGHTHVAGAIEGDQPVIRVAYAVDDDADFVAEGATIDEAEPELNEALVYTRKFAQLVRLTREQYRQSGTPEELANSISRAMTRKADNALLSQAAPVSPATAPVAGITNWPGVITETVADDLDALIDLEAEVRSNGAHPTAWLLAPSTWAAIRKLKTATGSNVSLIGAGTDDSEPRLLSIPVVVNAELAAGTGALVDNTAIISAVGPLEIATSMDQYFSSDSVGVKATWRTGHTIPRPDRIGVFTIGVEAGS